MSVIIRLQNLPWSANALDIRNFFRGLSIPEGGVHIVGGELGDAFIAFSTDEDARQGMMLDGGKIKEIQVKLLLSSRSEMHKVIEAARQSVPLPAVPPAPAAAPSPAPAPVPSFLSGLAPAPLSIPGLGNPLEVPQPAVIPPPAPLLSPPIIITPDEDSRDENRRSRDKRRTKSSSRSRSRSRDRKDRKRDRRDRSRSRERRRRDRPDRSERSRSRERRDRRERRRDRSRERSPRRRRESPPQNLDPSVQDAYSRLQEIGNKRNPNAFQGNGNSPLPASSPPVPAGQCVVIRNAPNHTSYGDVRKFFPAMIDKHGIKMINDNMGRRTGNIYVRFCEQRSKHIALTRRNNMLKNAPVTVEHLDEAEYEMAVDSFLPFREENTAPAAPPSDFTVLRLSELPFFVQEHDIIKALNEYSLLSIILNMNRVTRTKTALVQFAQPQDAHLALRNRDRLMFGKTRPQLTPVTDLDYEREKAMQTQDTANAQPPPQFIQPEPEVDNPAPPRDPRQRRPDVTPAPHFTPPPASAFPAFNSGGAFPERPWGRNFPAAGIRPPPDFQNSRSDFQNSRSDFQNSRSEFQNQDFQEFQASPKRQYPQNGTTPMIDESPECVLMKGLPRDATDRTIVEFLRETGAVPARIHLMLDGAGRPSGDCFCEFRTAADARRAVSRHGATLHDLRISVDLVPRSLVRAALDAPAAVPPLELVAPVHGPRSRPPSFRSRGGIRGRGRGRGPAPRDDDPALLEFGAPGCVVSMENVPFRATVDDILHFFSEFELSQDDVIRRFNERGQATGDARVAFPTPFDAQRAVKTHHMEMIYDRRITLTIV